MTPLVACLALATAVLFWPTAGSTLPCPPTRRGHRRPTPAPATPDAVADALVLLALALRAGCAPVEALEEVADRTGGVVASRLRSVAAADRWGLDADACWATAPPVWQPAAVAWEASVSAGVSPSGLIERSAGVIRDRERQRVEAALARAGVLLVLPLGLAFLPGFVATTVIPVVLRILGGFAGAAP